MQTEKTFLDDLARLATGAFGALGDVKGEVEARVRAQLERILARMNLPTREELDAVKELAAAARAEADALKKRVAALEGKAPKGPSAKGGTKTHASRGKATLVRDPKRTR
ncbi:MAG: accessory factor UbiK family protein [Alphaproteobacteria bacterium]|nr:accessory factor UbiK family protein [Alphaproteobacteria bacterium]MBM4436962.1 accessory factor UbiK family protein [Actinomycetota bacterium]